MDISVFITSENISTEKRVSPTWTIEQLKAKLEPITGIPPSSQEILIYSSPSTKVPKPASDDNTLLGQYNLAQYGVIHINDSRPESARINLNDTSEVEKYVMDEEDYDSRTDSVRQWKKTNQLGRFDPNYNKSIEEKQEQARQLIAEKGIEVGKRCQVTDRRGEVKFVGIVPEINETSWWVGVEFDEPTGKNDGAVQGKRYFEAKPNHGSFVKPDLVEVGDFPVEDLFDTDDEL
ncbi:tubulin-specific chaperone B [Trichomonascus vanleenenianus]|uniref:Alf1p n=1 Tax=Trichomonascus vanleenenianus TaxID=2268995 RepID=UPI003ECB3EA8